VIGIACIIGRIGESKECFANLVFCFGFYFFCNRVGDCCNVVDKKWEIGSERNQLEGRVNAEWGNGERVVEGV